MKSPIFSIHFSGPIELVASLLNRHFTSLPTEEQSIAWSCKHDAIKYCSRRKGRGARFTLGYDMPDEMREDVPGLVTEWVVMETPTSRRFVMHRGDNDWMACFPGGSCWIAPRLYQNLAFQDQVTLLAVHDAEGMKVIGSGPDPDRHYRLVKE